MKYRIIEINDPTKVYKIQYKIQYKWLFWWYDVTNVDLLAWGNVPLQFITLQEAVEYIRREKTIITERIVTDEEIEGMWNNIKG